MVEDRFPISGLSAEYGDIVIGGLTVSVFVTISYLGNILFTENYTPDSAGKIYIKNIGDVAMSLMSNDDFMMSNGYTGYGSVLLSVSIIGSETLTKDVTIYQSIVDFSGTLTIDMLKLIPLTRTTTKTTAYGRKEYISFYGSGTIKAYVVKIGVLQDEAVTVDVATYIEQSKIYNTDVSPSIIADLAGCPETDLIYYKIYKSTDFVIGFTMDERNYPLQKTFIFRNCFGAQETFTCVGDEKSARKWSRNFGSIDNKQVLINRDLENKYNVSTGNVSAADIEVIEDLINSKQISVIDEYGFHDIIITDENFNDINRFDELKSIDFTYKYVKSNQLRSFYKPQKKLRIFSNEFDETFS